MLSLVTLAQRSYVANQFVHPLKEQPGDKSSGIVCSLVLRVPSGKEKGCFCSSLITPLHLTDCHDCYVVVILIAFSL